MDGFEFEHLCERIFQKANWGDVQQIAHVADGGRDLIIHQPKGGSIVVECKHQPNTSIGRPIVQKLHSAVISSGAVKGIIVTSGRYSKEAIEHAKLLSKTTSIELIDRHKLIALAEEAKIKIIIGEKTASIHYFPASDITEIKHMISEKLDSLNSHPRTVKELMQITPNGFLLDSMYALSANIHQDFATSVGVIYSIHENDAYFIFNAQNGHIIQEDTSEFLKHATLTDSTKIPTIACRNHKTDFAIDVTTLKSKAINHIIQKFTVNVSYRGRNNVSYTKTCTPGPRSIQISDIKQVFLPRYDLSVNFLENSYSCHLIQNDCEIMMESRLYDCKICSKDTKGIALLCNACGNIAHNPKFFGSHSHICKNCKKTICKNCTFWHRRFVFFKKILCEECADAHPKSKHKLTK